MVVTKPCLSLTDIKKCMLDFWGSVREIGFLVCDWVFICTAGFSLMHGLSPLVKRLLFVGCFLKAGALLLLKGMCK